MSNEGDNNPSKGLYLVKADSPSKRITLPASSVVSELKEKVLPKLELERERIWAERVALGLKPRNPLYPNEGPKYSPLSDEKRALEKAVESIGGEYFVQAKRQVEKLEDLDLKAERSLEYLNRTHKGLRRFTPEYFKKKNFLTTEQQKVRKGYNEAVTRYNVRVEYLNRPEVQKQVLDLAEKILKDEAKLDLRRQALDKGFDRIEAHIERSQDIKRKLNSLGDTPLEIKRTAVKLGGETIKVPVPIRIQEVVKSQTQNLAQSFQVRKLTR